MQRTKPNHQIETKPRIALMLSGLIWHSNHSGKRNSIVGVKAGDREGMVFQHVYNRTHPGCHHLSLHIRNGQSKRNAKRNRDATKRPIRYSMNDLYNL